MAADDDVVVLNIISVSPSVVWEDTLEPLVVLRCAPLVMREGVFQLSRYLEVM